MGEKKDHSGTFYHNDKPNEAAIEDEYQEENTEQGQKDPRLSGKKH
ncbi:MAG: hypothetical protein ACYS1A_14035 [Planctomycetota bacterium]